ncbi:hypothetical protein [Clostridium sp. AWRP]|nr:hypothetical protein [Clostridium sp. AWRP]
MERYVLVCTIGGNALKFHEKLRNDVCYKFQKSNHKIQIKIQ